MLRYLVDTHVLLWFQLGEDKIPSSVLQKIQDPANIVYFSQISLYEIAIKQKIGKLPDLNANVNEIYHQAIKDRFTFLPILNEHLCKYEDVPLLEVHKDPFDRLFIATGMEEDSIIVTSDKNFGLYPGLVEVFW